MQKIILHIDFDSFFASVEQQDNPLFRNRPIGVTATNGRTCIIAASKEAKRLGIKSPSNTYVAQKICPSIIFVPAHFVRYWEISKKFIKICDDFSPTVEIFSIDEVFMDVSLTTKLFGGAQNLIKKLKQRLREEIGEHITASVGISHNKLLAKLASGIRKPARHASPCLQGVAGGPDGVFEINQENIWDVYKSCKLTDICGIGYGINKRLNQMGIYSPIQLKTVPLEGLVSEFGQVQGNILQNIGMGIDENAVIPYSQRDDVKSVGRQYCLPHNEYDKRKILQNIYELCEEVANKLRRLKKKTRTVGIYLGGDISKHGRLTIERYVDSGIEIFRICQSILKQESRSKNQGVDISLIHDSYFMIPSYVRRIGIWTSSLENADNIPSSIFERDQKEQKLAQIIDKINDKFGDHTIRNGFLLYSDKLTTMPNGYGASVKNDPRYR